MNPLDFIPKSLMGIAILVLMTTNFSCAMKNGQLELEVSRKATQLAQAQLDHATAAVDAQKAYNATATAYRKKEQALQTAMNQTKEKSDAQVAAVTAQYDAMRVRYTMSASAYSPGYRAAAAVASIAEAPRPDSGTFVSGEVGLLVDEAFRADQIRIALGECYKAYDDAQSALK